MTHGHCIKSKLGQTLRFLVLPYSTCNGSCLLFPFTESLRREMKKKVKLHGIHVIHNLVTFALCQIWGDSGIWEVRKIPELIIFLRGNVEIIPLSLSLHYPSHWAREGNIPLFPWLLTEPNVSKLFRYSLTAFIWSSKSLSESRKHGVFFMVSRWGQ